MKPFDISKKAKVDIIKIKNLMASVGLNKGIFEKIIPNLIDGRKNYLKMMGYNDEHLVEYEIRLSLEVECKIREAYKESNMLLAKILEREINDLGY